MYLIRFSAVLTILTLICGLPARSEDDATITDDKLVSQLSVGQLRGIIRAEIEQREVELRGDVAEVTEPERARERASDDSGERGPQPLPAGPTPLLPGPTLPAPATPTLGWKQQIIDHYKTNMAGANSFSSDPRKAAEALKAIFDRHLADVQKLEDEIESAKASEMMEVIRAEVASFFQENQASAKDWREFLLKLKDSAGDPTKKQTWTTRLTELRDGFDEVAKMILQEEFADPFKRNVGITAARASPAAVGAASGGGSGTFGGGHRVRHTVRRSETGWSVEHEWSGPFHRVIRKRSYGTP